MAYVIPTMIFLLIVLKYIEKVVLIPMKNINEATQNILQRNFKYRITSTNDYETGRLIELFNNMIQELENKENELKNIEHNKKIFVDALSHDIKTPLSLISAYNEALSDGIIEVNEIPRITEDIQKKNYRYQNIYK